MRRRKNSSQEFYFLKNRSRGTDFVGETFFQVGFFSRLPFPCIRKEVSGIKLVVFKQVINSCYLILISSLYFTTLHNIHNIQNLQKYILIELSFPLDQTRLNYFELN